MKLLSSVWWYIPLLAFASIVGPGMASCLGQVLIHEIMYHPSSGLSEDEYVELRNIGPDPVDLTGWEFTRGIHFTFPNITLASNGYVVVAADLAHFIAEYGELGALGPWEGSLSNSGERITLKDASGATQCDLEYTDQGDWATRIQEQDEDITEGEMGWTWHSGHDGGGSSLELTSITLPSITDEGQLWTASITPTPGAANSTAVAAFAPVITKVQHTPPIPSSTDPVHITAKVRDIAGSAIAVSLYHRVSTFNPGGFQMLTMVDDGMHGDGEAGDAIYGATLPSQPDHTVVEFYIEATNGTDSRTWPAPTDLGQIANCLYQVDNEPTPTDSHFYRLLMTLEDEEDYDNFDESSNAQVNSTLISYDCKDVSIRYRCGTRIRGASSRSRSPRPMRINIPRDDRLRGRSEINFHVLKSYLQLLGQRIFQASGLPATKAWQAQLRRNGTNLTPDKTEGKHHGSWIRIQPLNGEYVDETFPADAQGNLYRNGRWTYLENANYGRKAWAKKTNVSLNDYSDVHAVMGVLTNSTGDSDYLSQLEAVADVDQWLTWFGIMALLANSESNLSGGHDSDYASYTGINDPRLKLIPHDLDSILFESSYDPASHTLFDMVEDDDIIEILVPLFDLPEIRQRYYQTLRRLLDTTFSKSYFDHLVAFTWADWVPAETQQITIDWMDTRRAYATGAVNLALGPHPGILPPSAEDTFTSPPANDLMLSEILASNTSITINATTPDYIEITNQGDTAINLSGLRLTDTLDSPDKYQFPEGVTLGSDEHMLLLATDGPDWNHLGFKLNQEGEAVYLLPADSLEPIDSLVFGCQIANHSIGRVSGSANAWALNTPTPGSTNVQAATGTVGELKFNEWLASTDFVHTRDYVELYNPNTAPLALGGITLSNDPWTDLQDYHFPSLSFMDGTSWKVLASAAASPSADELPFNLDASFGMLSLLGANAVEIDKIFWTCQLADVSYGRTPDGGTAIASMPMPTIGRSNSDTMLDMFAIRDQLRVVELDYAPADGSDYEFIKLQNIGATAIQLDNVSFSQGIEFDFPATTIAPGDHVFIANSRDQYEVIYGLQTNLLGQYKGKLSNGGEKLRIEIAPYGFGVSEFTYDDAWYPSTDGNGDRLQVVDADAPQMNWNLASQWQAVASPINHPYALWVLEHLGTTKHALAGRPNDADSDGLTNQIEWAFRTLPHEFTQDGLPEFLEISPNTRFGYQRNLEATQLEFIIMESTNLRDWHPSTSATDQSLEIIGSIDKREVTTGHSSDRRAFLQVEVRPIP